MGRQPNWRFLPFFLQKSKKRSRQVLTLAVNFLSSSFLVTFYLFFCAFHQVRITEKLHVIKNSKVLSRSNIQINLEACIYCAISITVMTHFRPIRFYDSYIHNVSVLWKNIVRNITLQIGIFANIPASPVLIFDGNEKHEIKWLLWIILFDK